MSGFHRLILVEGETEEEFYTLFSAKFFPRRPKTIQNLRGNWNINNKILEKATRFSERNPNTQFTVYVCVDQERLDTPAFNCGYVTSELEKKKVNCTIHPVIATLMIESLLFTDIDGIYAFLRTPHPARKPTKYREFRRLTHKDLTHLFRQFGKSYIKGHRTRNFLTQLDLDKIQSACAELKHFAAHAGQ